LSGILILSAYADKAKLLLKIILSDVLLRNRNRHWYRDLGRIGRRIDYY